MAQDGLLPSDRPAVAKLPFALQVAAPTITLFEIFVLMGVVFLLTRRRLVPNMASRAPHRQLALRESLFLIGYAALGQVGAGSSVPPWGTDPSVSTLPARSSVVASHLNAARYGPGRFTISSCSRSYPTSIFGVDTQTPSSICARPTRWREPASGCPLWEWIRQRKYFVKCTRSPGQSTGTTGILTDTGAYTQNSAGSLDIAIGGATPGTKFDQFTSTTATLGGTLNINLINGFVPTIGSKFKIVNFTSESGQFATVNGLAINSSEHFNVTYQGADVLLTVASGAAPSSLARLNSFAMLSSRPSDRMSVADGHFTLAENVPWVDSMNANSRIPSARPTDRGMRVQSMNSASQFQSINLGFNAVPATNAAPLANSERPDSRVSAAFAMMAEHYASAANASNRSAKLYAFAPLHSSLDARARLGGKVARGNLQFSLLSLHSRPRMSLSLD